MRDLEFRAWNTKNKIMQNVCFLSWLQGGLKAEDAGVYIANGWVTVDKSCPGQEDIEPEVILMQYTGLKDKNGNKIFEGDNLKPYSAYCDNICTVIFHKGSFTARGGSDWKELDSYHGVSIREWEVIGNIYENPELLKEQP